MLEWKPNPKKPRNLVAKTRNDYCLTIFPTKDGGYKLAVEGGFFYFADLQAAKDWAQERAAEIETRPSPQDRLKDWNSLFKELKKSKQLHLFLQALSGFMVKHHVQMEEPNEKEKKQQQHVEHGQI